MVRKGLEGDQPRLMGEENVFSPCQPLPSFFLASSPQIFTTPQQSSVLHALTHLGFSTSAFLVPIPPPTLSDSYSPLLSTYPPSLTSLLSIVGHHFGLLHPKCHTKPAALQYLSLFHWWIDTPPICSLTFLHDKGLQNSKRCWKST